MEGTKALEMKKNLPYIFVLMVIVTNLLQIAYPYLCLFFTLPKSLALSAWDSMSLGFHKAFSQEH